MEFHKLIFLECCQTGIFWSNLTYDMSVWFASAITDSSFANTMNWSHFTWNARRKQEKIPANEILWIKQLSRISITLQKVSHYYNIIVTIIFSCSKRDDSGKKNIFVRRKLFLSIFSDRFCWHLRKRTFQQGFNKGVTINLKKRELSTDSKDLKRFSDGINIMTVYVESGWTRDRVFVLKERVSLTGFRQLHLVVREYQR